MASWVRDRLSLGSSRNSNVVNSREVSSQIVVSNWKVPRQKIETIYQRGKFDFSTALSIKDHEETFSLDETILLKAESDNITTFTPKLLKQNEITIPQEFIIQNTRPPKNIAQKNIQQIIEETDGRVLIRFNLSKERNLSSKSLENLELPRTSYSTPSRSASYDYLKDNQVEDTQKIYYKAPIAEPIAEATSSIGSQLTQLCSLRHFPP